MEDSRGIRRGKCATLLCHCDGYVPGTEWKCKSCWHLPGQHEKTFGRDVQTPRQQHAYPHGCHTHTNYDYNQHASYNPGLHHSFQSVMESTTNVASTSTSSQHQCHVVPRCTVCSNNAYYDVELMKYFEYCSGDCRDKDLLANNVRDTKSDISRLEQSIKTGHAGLALPKTKSGGKVNCHKCDSFSFGSAITGICSDVVCVAKNNRKTPPTTTNLKTPQITSDVSRRGKEKETSRDARAAQSTIRVKVLKKGKESLGLFLSNSQSPGNQGCIITGYKRESPIGQKIYYGELHLLDVVLKVNDLDIENCKEFDKIVRDCYSVDLTCRIQKEHHVVSVCGFDVPRGVTHVFALRYSQGNQSIGIECYGYKSIIKTISKESLAEKNGLKISDEIEMFAVMMAPGQMKNLEKFKDYTPLQFSVKLKEAFIEVTSSLSTILLFINRKN